MTDVPCPPADLHNAGQALWLSILEHFELQAHEELLLHEAARTADTLADLARIIEAEGVTVTTRLGEVKVHPAVAEARSYRLALNRMLAGLRVPLGSDEDHEAKTSSVKRAPRRGPRGVYGVGGAA